MQVIPQHFTDAKTLREKVLYVLYVLHKASVDEVAMEIMELQGVASEEGVAALTIDVEEEVRKLGEERRVVPVKEHRQKKRYIIVDSQRN